MEPRSDSERWIGFDIVSAPAPIETVDFRFWHYLFEVQGIAIPEAWIGHYKPYWESLPELCGFAERLLSPIQAGLTYIGVTEFLDPEVGYQHEPAKNCPSKAFSATWLGLDVADYDFYRCLCDPHPKGLLTNLSEARRRAKYCDQMSEEHRPYSVYGIYKLDPT